MKAIHYYTHSPSPGKVVSAFSLALSNIYRIKKLQYDYKTAPFLLRILFETFVAACFTKRTLRIWDFSLPTKSSQIPLSPHDIGTSSYLITATGISACDI